MSNDKENFEKILKEVEIKEAELKKDKEAIASLLVLKTNFVPVIFHTPVLTLITFIAFYKLSTHSSIFKFIGKN